MEDSQDTSEPFDPLEALVESSLPLVFEAYDAALKERIREPVILLIDCEDEIGREIAEAWLGREAVEDALIAVQAEQADASAGECTTVFVQAMPRETCRRDVPLVFPYLKVAFDHLPPRAVLVMAVTGGGAATFIVPLESRP